MPLSLAPQVWPRWQAVPRNQWQAATSFGNLSGDVPLTADADVVVCGAGPAGVSAAIAAARLGASVRLFEAHGCLGGVWTSGLLGYLLDFDKPGFNQELVQRLRERDAVRGEGMNGLSYEPEEMKVLLEELCMAAGVKVQLHTRVAAAYRTGRRLSTIMTESKSGARRGLRRSLSMPQAMVTLGRWRNASLNSVNQRIVLANR